MRPKHIAVASLMFAAACNTTATMELPTVEKKDLIEVTEPTEKQASFALSKIVANIKRGTIIAHFPAAGVEGTDGYLCNYKHMGDSTLEWGTGTAVLGNWSSELGEVFYQALNSKGLNIAGSPTEMFRRSEAVYSAEYLVGARITKISGNICQSHHWWDGRPLDEYSGEMFVDVEWTIFSSILQRRVLKTSTQGYFKQVKAKRNGIVLAFHEAFAIAAENLLTSQRFVDIASGKAPVDIASSPGPVRYFFAKKLSSKSLKKRIETVLSSVVTVRLGLGHGSGFVISENGLILTNQHVVGDSKRVGIVLSNGIEIEGMVLARNAGRDVALIKIPLRVPSYLPVRLERPARLEKTFVIGTPIKAGLRSTVTSGVVSAIRIEPRSGLSFIQSDAAISPGNSGGPLLDENGNVIGISVIKFIGNSSEGLNLFIPIDEALEALNLKPKPASSR
ncbi:MAG: serine protease [Proteobacteria bacterium]|nr:serine protease [Pseudomonadota bacterium]